MNLKKHNGGFTLIESILASVILCVSVLALASLSTRTLVETRLNRQYEGALAVAARHLAIVDYIGVEDFLQLNRMEGDSTESQQTYHWKITAQSADIANLCEVSVSVSWTQRNQLYSVTAATRLNASQRAVLAMGR